MEQKMTFQGKNVQVHYSKLDNDLAEESDCL